MSCQVAVVLLSVLNEHTARALQFAESLAPQVIALHLRGAEISDVERDWCMGTARLPLVIVDAPDGDRASGLRRALAVLRRTQHADLITVVVPWQPTRAYGDEFRLQDLASGNQTTVIVQHAPGPG